MALGMGLGCPADAPNDPLDPELIQTLSMAQGSAGPSTRPGGWSFVFTTDTCDCPELELEGQPVALCDFITLAALDANLSEASGFLILDFPAAMLGAFTGAVDADGSFIVAGRHDATNLAGPLELLGRLDGQFTAGDTQASGSGGQRLIGAWLSESIDCRWTGDFEASHQ